MLTFLQTLFGAWHYPQFIVAKLTVNFTQQTPMGKNNNFCLVPRQLNKEHWEYTAA